MGHFIVLLRHARRTLPAYFRLATLQPRPYPWCRRTTLESNLHVNSRRYRLQGALCPKILPRLRGKYHPDRLHDDSKQLLHAARTIRTPVLVVQFHRSLHHHRWRVELRIRTDNF